MDFTHLNAQGQAAMVDVSHKALTVRKATAQASIFMPAAILERIVGTEIVGPKGPVIQTAILAGTMAAKKTSDLIPLCHPLPLSQIAFTSHWNEDRLRLECTVTVEGKTGVEMEALTGVSVAALTVYDMCKALSQEMVIEDIRLLAKSGGKRAYAVVPS
jgi:cyclic pyranopterin phosphate synthase